VEAPVTGATLRAPDRISSGRVAWIDGLKVATIAGVVVFHAATAYLTDVAGWYYEERTTSQLTSWGVGAPGAVLALFVLGPLFVVGGALAASSLARSGVRPFVRRRLVRLGVPLLVFVVLVDPLADLLGHSAQGLAPGVWATLGPASEVRDVGPLWFVSVLLVCSLALAVWPARDRVRSEPRPLRPRHLVGAAAVLAAGSFLVRVRWPFTADALLDLRFAQWPQAAALFAVGVLVRDHGGFERVPAAWARRAGGVAGLGAVGVVVLGGVVMLSAGGLEPMLGGWRWASAGLAVLEAATAVGASLWVIDRVRRRWTVRGPLLARTSRGAYAAYVLHPLVLVALSAAARPLPWPPEGKFVLVAAAGVIGSFALGTTVTRWRPVARVL
jgi:glucans biosynthesis protein C